MAEQYLVEPTDLTPVLESLDGIREDLLKLEEVITETAATEDRRLVQLDTRLEQLHIDTVGVFFAVCCLIGVVVGCAIGKRLSHLWR